ncbi:hypothetical protein BAUCODRAFT_30294 [Baudoinia panamericana UAMH 10762]|uniref:Uncharacterized protein n=1 Tax=Baudoinia panamericana (strain UAMH 10762) TaxID=717646 RepID=M2NL58_BAUPA|nr:uncharacterized protein BAUCODRAFT_30294 [Baudoinia panamericana UAMH 10762]EMC99885.1 hypothetical protein BAUCODRAFT_30294 [Baudoinia panamericana UAMH 10762]
MTVASSHFATCDTIRLRMLPDVLIAHRSHNVILTVRAPVPQAATSSHNQHRSTA